MARKSQSKFDVLVNEMTNDVESSKRHWNEILERNKERTSDAAADDKWREDAQKSVVLAERKLKALNAGHRVSPMNNDKDLVKIGF